MRILPACLLLAAACGSTAGTERADPTAYSPGQIVRVLHAQYRDPPTVFIVESIAGRDIVEMRSRPLPPGETPVAYVPDDVVAKMLEEFRRFDFPEFARPRPSSPEALGASGEITVTDARGRRHALLRIKAPKGATLTKDQVEAARAYGDCVKTFLAVWSAYPPRMQATTSRRAFGVPRGNP